MRPSLVRCLALGALVAGVAAIVWTAVRGDDPGDDSAASLVTADASGEAAEAASAGRVDAASTAAGSTAETAPAPSDAEFDPQTADGSAAAAATADTAPEIPEASDIVTGLPEASDIVTTGPATTVPAEPIEVLGEADTLTGLDGWLNTEAASLEEIRAANKLTVVQFWTFGCRNCKNTLEALGQLYADFRDHGVEIVGVHSPEFSYEADVNNIIEASADLGVIWPIALDTNKRNFHRWQPGNIGYWPRVYVIDNDNQIRFDRTGDGRATYEKLYETVEQLLAEA